MKREIVWSRYVKLCRWMEKYGQDIFKLDEINDEWFKEMEQREQEEAQEAWEPEN